MRIHHYVAGVVFISLLGSFNKYAIAQNNSCPSVVALPSLVSVNNRQLIVQKRNPDGSLMAALPYIIKAVAWSPASDTTNPDLHHPNGVLRREFSNWYKTDIPLLKKMNVNTIRTFTDFGDGDSTKKILDELYCNDIMVILTVDDAQNDTARIRKIVTANKNHPAILMWLIGNEWNIYPHYYDSTMSLAQAVQKTQIAASLIKSIDPMHLVASSLGEINIPADSLRLADTKNYVDFCSSVDIWGLNIYRSNFFGSLFNEWKSISNKPMFLCEYGTDAFNRLSQTSTPDEVMQARWDISLWKDIVRNLSAYDSSKATIGGTVFEWNDEWWKTGSVYTQDSGGYEGGHPDGFANEEYFGIVDIHRNKRSVYDSLRIGFRQSYNAPAANIIFKAESAGLLVPGTFNGFVKFYRDSIKFYNGEGQVDIQHNRGFNVVAIDTATGSFIVPVSSFDTWITSPTGEQMRKMLRLLDSLPNGTMIMIAVRDEAGLTSIETTGCTRLQHTWVDSCYNALIALGSTQLQNYCYENSWAMIAIKGQGVALAEERWLGDTAIVQTTLHLRPTSYPVQFPLTPTLLSPSCDTLVMTTNITLRWNSSESSTAYRMQASYDSLFNSFLKDTTTADTTYSLNGLINRKSYFWRVRAINSAGSSRWSCTRKFAARILPIAEVLSPPVRLPADTLKVKYQFFNPLNTGNSFLIQMTDTSGGANTFRQIANFLLTDSAGIFKIILPDTTLCGNKYKARVLSTSPVDTSLNSNQFEIINTIPKPIITQNGGQLQSPSASAYRWFKDNVIIPGANTQFYTPVNSGSYRLQVTKYNCLSDTSDPVNFTVTAIIDPAGWNGIVSIFPNPVLKQLHIVNNDPSKKLFLQLYDITGRLLENQSLKNGDNILVTDRLASGSYLLLLTDKNKNESLKKIITKL